MPGLRFDPVLIEGSPALPPRAGTAPRGYARSTSQNPVDVAPATTRGVRKVLRWMPNPRIIATYRATQAPRVHRGGGIYGQPPDPEDMSPVFGNPASRLSRAMHLSGGVNFKLRPTLTLEIVGFYKRMWDLVSRNDDADAAAGRSR